MVLSLFVLAGCRGLIEIPPQPPVIPLGDKVEILPGGAELIQPAAPAIDLNEWCNQRARHYSGTVIKRCADIARETK